MQERQWELPAQESASPRGYRWGRILIWVFVLGFLSLLLLGLRRSQEGRVRPGARAPDFLLTTFEGEQIRLQDLRGKVVVLNFWASWCKPCEQEAADLQAAWEHYRLGGQVVFLGVGYLDTEPDARAYLERFQITYPNGPDLGTRIARAYRLRGVPETFLIDRNGVLADVQVGPFLSFDQIRAAIDPLLLADD